jgi:hypothetical protein
MHKSRLLAAVRSSEPCLWSLKPSNIFVSGTTSPKYSPAATYFRELLPYETSNVPLWDKKSLELPLYEFTSYLLPSARVWRWVGLVQLLTALSGIVSSQSAARFWGFWTVEWVFGRKTLFTSPHSLLEVFCNLALVTNSCSLTMLSRT